MLKGKAFCGSWESEGSAENKNTNDKARINCAWGDSCLVFMVDWY